MSPTARALLGAALGSLLTLVVHPVSRPFLIALTSHVSQPQIKRAVQSNWTSPPPPKTLAEAGLWMELAASRLNSHQRFSTKETQSLLDIVAAAESRDVGNAFWPQMASAILFENGNVAGAISKWATGSLKPGWDDYQIKRLKAARSDLVAATGVQQSWQLAYIYFTRSEDIGACLRATAREILARADYDTEPGLRIRYATLLNADLIREHAHSSATSVSAMDIVDLVTYPADSLSGSLGTIPSPKSLQTGEVKVVSNFTKILKTPDWTTRAKAIFSNTESWRALTIHDSNRQEAQLLAVSSVVTSSMASVMAALALLGTAIWGLGRFVAWKMRSDKKIGLPTAAAIALVFGGFVFALTKDIAGGIAACLCAGFLSVSPTHTRNARPEDLGPLFRLIVLILSVICSAMFVIYLVGTTSAAGAVFGCLGVPAEFMESPLLAGIAAVCFGMLLLTAPIWAIVHRLTTPHVLSLSLSKFGAFAAASGLCLSVVLGPVAVYADQRLESTFNELVTNEPDHYYLHR